MNAFVKVISNAVEGAYRKIKTKRYIGNDLLTPKQATPFGIDSAPYDGMIAIYADTNKSGNPVIIGYINRQHFAGNGEIRIYSLDENKSLATYVWCKADGVLELGGNDRNATAYQGLEEAFNELKGKFNDLVQAFNQHSHTANNTPPTAIPSVIPAQESDANITEAKIDQIKTI